MLTYNSQLKKLALPEYGRNIQQMVDYCCTIEDREERNKCAYSIINTMSNLFPQLRDEIDTKPIPVQYKLEPIKMRHYGKIVDQMIQRACEYPDGEEKDALVMLIANHMKKLIYQINNEDVDDAKIFKDLEFYSKGRIKLSTATHSLHEFKVAPTQQQTSKKKKKK